MSETPKYIYSAEPKRGEDVGLFEQGPFIIVRVYVNGEHAPVEGELEYQYSPDAWARACRLNREQIGIGEQAANIFLRQSYRAERERKEAEVKRVEAARRAAEAAKRDRQREADIARGAPQGRSPHDVWADKEHYELVADVDGNTYPSSVQRVVRHKATGSLWAASFAIREDDSDAELGAHWTEVEAKTEMRTVYVAKTREP